MIAIMPVKVRMRAFLKSMDEWFCVSLEKGSTIPSTIFASIVIPTNISTCSMDDLVSVIEIVDVSMLSLWLFSSKSLNGYLCVRLRKKFGIF